MSEYKDLDLSLFKLNENGEPLALPWIEQDFMWLEMFQSSGPELAEKINLHDRSGRKLYMTTFDPEIHLVGEGALFKGWNFESNHLGHYDFGNITFARGQKLSGELIGFLQEYRDNKLYQHLMLEYPYPVTISDFINDCNRAGIPLVWSPEGVRRLTNG